MAYAARTSVPADQTRSEIENLLKKFGAKKIGVMLDDTEITIGFVIGLCAVRIVLPTDNISERQQMQRWRALLLVVKAKLESVECGISTLEREFLADVVTSNGETVYNRHRAEIDQMQNSGQPPRLMLTA